MFRKNPETGNSAVRPGYPVRILGRFAIHPKEVLSGRTIPTADQIFEVACEAVKFTQKANSYPGAIITGKYITAAPESAKNGSIFFPISAEGKTRSLDLLRELLHEDVPDLNRVQGIGVYVTSSKKKASAVDIDEIGMVLCDDNADKISDTLMDRKAVGELSEAQQQQLGDLLSVVAYQADMAYGSKLQHLAR